MMIPICNGLIQITLESAGFETVQAGTGKQAWNLLEGTKIDLVVLDVMMPEMDGWTLCQHIRENWALPVIMATALGDVSQKVKGFGLGADDYLTQAL